MILCGVEIPYESGLLGHSDADVALHALMDALLGAAGLGDIGRHFPDTDMKFKDADSMLLLRQVVGLLQKHGWQINNADVTIMAQRPKLAPYIEQMAANIAREMRIARSAVNVKATTTEEIRFCWTGRRDGVRGCCKYYQMIMQIRFAENELLIHALVVLFEYLVRSFRT